MERDRWTRLRPWAAALAVIAAALHVSLSMRGGYWFVTHERIWYPVRVVEYVQSWRAGSLYPRWCPDLYGGYGYPFFNYYSPGLYATAGIVMLAFGTTAATALKLAVGLFTIAGGLGMYGLVRGETRRGEAALLSAIVYVYLPYHFTDLFTRGDLAEYAAFSLLPFALWGYRALARAEAARVPRVGMLAALAHAAVWFCHTITGLYTTEILALMLLVTAVVHRRRPAELRRAAVGGAVFVLALLIAAVYVMPAWLERSAVHLENLRGGIYHPTKNLVYWKWLLDDGFFSIGFPIVAGVPVAILSLGLPGPRRNAAALARWWLPAMLISAATLSWAEPLWNLLPLGAYIQFPWRLIGFVGAFGAVGIGVTIALLLPEKWTVARWVVCSVLALGVVYIERGYNHAGTFVDGSQIPSTPEEIRKEILTSVLTNEYLPMTAASPPTRPRPQSVIAIAGAPVTNTRVLTPLRYLLEIDAGQASVVEVQVFDFPGWKVETEQAPAPVERSVTPSGLIRLALPRAGHYRLRIYFGLTWLRAFAGALTCFALLFGVLVLRRLNRWSEAEPRA